MRAILGKRVARTQLLREVLESLPREQWGESNAVARAYLECPKTAGILKHLGFKYHVPESLYPDVMQTGWFILARQFPTLDEPKNVYSYLYAVIQNVIRSMKANSHRVEHLRTDDEESDEEQPVKPLAEFDQGAQPDHAGQVISVVDLARAQQRFADKLTRYNWPADIIRDEREYGRVGRPRKEDAVVATVKDDLPNSASEIETFL